MTGAETEATLVVNLPADAQLTVDGSPTESTTGTRVFSTPALEPGQEYYYTLEIKVVRDGKVASATQRVTVRPGEETRVNLDVPEVVAAAE